jgi:hypothetical protein
MDELPTERTEIMMTTFMTEGRTLIPAFWMDITKGDALGGSVTERDREGCRAKKSRGHVLCVGVALPIEESWVIVRHQCAYYEQAHYVEQSDTPKDLSSRQRRRGPTPRD